MPAPPPISRWGHVWRYGLTVLISGIAWVELAIWQWQHARWWFWLDLAVGLLCLGLVHWRRRWPLAIALLTNLLTAVSASAGGPATLTMFSLATRRRWREIIPLGTAAILVGFAFAFYNPVAPEGSFVITVPIIVAVVAVVIGWGMYVGSRRELLATLQERAENAESEQAARVAQARIAERNRIAREMHDVLAHRISMVTMHAGALSYRDDLTVEQMRESAAVIQQSSHQALVELREVLGILRDENGEVAPNRPQPGVGDVPTLVDEARAAGLRVALTLDIDIDAVPELIGRTAYRVVQEGLTNVRKHASQTSVIVQLTGSADEGLDVLVRNPLPIGTPEQRLPASGLGLVGLRERVELAGGRLSHTVTTNRDFVLDAWLPWPS